MVGFPVVIWTERDKVLWCVDFINSRRLWEFRNGLDVVNMNAPRILADPARRVLATGFKGGLGMVSDCRARVVVSRTPGPKLPLGHAGCNWHFGSVAGASSRVLQPSILVALRLECLPAHLALADDHRFGLWPSSPLDLIR